MQYGNYVKVVNNDLNLRVNDKTLELIGYAYGSDKVFTDELLRVIDIRDYNDEEYIVVDNTSSEFNEVYLIKEEALEEVTIEHTVSELETLLGGGENEIKYQANKPTVILLVGLQGSGKTTTAGKLAYLMKNKFIYINTFFNLFSLLVFHT